MRDLAGKPPPDFIIFRRASFCKNTPKSVFNEIYNIQVFQDTYSQNGFFPHAFQSRDPAARPTRPPVMDHRLSNCFVSSISRFTGYQTGSCSSISRYTGYQHGLCSSISRFTGYQNDSFSNISNISRFPI